MAGILPLRGDYVLAIGMGNFGRKRQISNH